MKQQLEILEITSELAGITTFDGGPADILKILKDKFNLTINPQAEVRQLNDALFQHTYTVNRSTFQTTISFLFHALSGRWYVRAVG
ncbi:MAG: hypothetical protein R3275_11745 [Saprospiraceae bacterium]|nr:hypothetical protein [Saprospiraceae bacterium]